MKFEFNKRNIILISVFLLTIFGFYLLYNHRNPNNRGKDQDERIVLVNDYSRFFTVSNAVSSYVNRLAEKDKDALYLILDEKYKEENNITKSNVLEKIGTFEADGYTFSARKMYQETLSGTMIKYYVYGHLRERLFNTYVRPTDYYVVLILDTKNFTFSVIPDNGSLFEEVRK